MNRSRLDTYALQYVTVWDITYYDPFKEVINYY